MAKTALGIAALIAVFAVLVLAAGSIPAQRQIQARSGTQLHAVDRGHVIADKRADAHGRHDR